MNQGLAIEYWSGHGRYISLAMKTSSFSSGTGRKIHENFRTTNSFCDLHVPCGLNLEETSVGSLHDDFLASNGVV
jgi:hypothetical protein